MQFFANDGRITLTTYFKSIFKVKLNATNKPFINEFARTRSSCTACTTETTLIMHAVCVMRDRHENFANNRPMNFSFSLRRWWRRRWRWRRQQRFFVSYQFVMRLKRRRRRHMLHETSSEVWSLYDFMVFIRCVTCARDYLQCIKSTRSLSMTWRPAMCEVRTTWTTRTTNKPFSHTFSGGILLRMD